LPAAGTGRNSGAVPGTSEPVTATVDVLIVDDQAPFRDVARTVVSVLAGWRVVAEAASGLGAVAAVEQAGPSVVLMDINLPDISGIEATRRISARWPDVRVVLVSTYAADDVPTDAATCGALAYLRKEELTPARLRALVS
jgi:DNA-binding NarL/FixJ family response regulator